MTWPRTLRSLLLSTAWLACAPTIGVAQLAQQGAYDAEATVPETTAPETPKTEDHNGTVDGILVLRNGNVLKGKIQRLADFYRIEMPRSELQIRVEQVESFCHNLDEAYELRRRQRTGSSADTHVELARWCLRHELLEYSSRELLDARSIDPGHRQLPLLERQLQLALKNRVARHRPIPLADAAKEPTDNQRKSLESVPHWARTLFVRQIQPLLVDSCSTSGCHQPGSSDSFHLNRLAREGAGHPATTARNLAATLAQLDLQSPENSELLKHAKIAHGAEGTLPLKPHRFQMLVRWVEQLSLAKKNAPVNDIALVSHHEDSSVDALPLIRKALEESTAEPADPFDPERFNTRHSADKN